MKWKIGLILVLLLLSFGCVDSETNTNNTTNLSDNISIINETNIIERYENISIIEDNIEELLNLGDNEIQINNIYGSKQNFTGYFFENENKSFLFIPSEARENVKGELRLEYKIFLKENIEAWKKQGTPINAEGYLYINETQKIEQQIIQEINRYNLNATIDDLQLIKGKKVDFLLNHYPYLAYVISNNRVLLIEMYQLDIHH